MKHVLIQQGAEADIEEAFSWYESQRPGLGQEFSEALRDALGTIRANPEIYQVVHRNTRRALLRRFPYGVFYRIFPDVIVVVACLHGHRDPKRWRTRS